MSNKNNNNEATGGRRFRGKKRIKNENVSAANIPNINLGKNEKSGSQGNIRTMKPIGFLALEKAMASMDHSKFLLEITSNHFGFLTLLQKNTIEPGIMCLILSAFVKAVNSPTDGESRKMVLYFLEKILPNKKSSENFMRKVLPVFVMNLQKYTSPIYHERQRYIQAILDLLKFIRQVQLIMPQGSRDIVSDIVPGLQAQIEYINRKGICFTDETMALLADITNSIENLNIKGEVVSTFEIPDEPPEDFRLIQVCPDSHDILHNHEPYIRKNVVDGKYVGGVDHYLDVQFRLLREDFIRPLREGIGEYLRLSQDKTRRHNLNRIKDVNIYNQVNVMSSVFSNGDLTYIARFETTNFNKVRWQVRSLNNAKN